MVQILIFETRCAAADTTSCHHVLLQYSLQASLQRLRGFKVLFMPQVNYKNVMKQYGLGPNGGILTSLNLFATRFDQVRQSTAMPVLHDMSFHGQTKDPSHDKVWLNA